MLTTEKLEITLLLQNVSACFIQQLYGVCIANGLSGPRCVFYVILYLGLPFCFQKISVFHLFIVLLFEFETSYHIRCPYLYMPLYTNSSQLYHWARFLIPTCSITPHVIGDPFHQQFMSLWIKSFENKCCSNSVVNDLIRSQSCTCHNSWADVACAKSWIV